MCKLLYPGVMHTGGTVSGVMYGGVVSGVMYGGIVSGGNSCVECLESFQTLGDKTRTINNKERLLGQTASLHCS